MRVGILAALLFFTSAGVRGEDWYKGSVTLKSHKRLAGEVSYVPQYESVLLKNGDAVMVFPAHLLDSFSFYDGGEETVRVFVSVRVTIGAAAMHQLYELVVEGKLRLFRKQHAVWYSLRDDLPDFEYYILDGGNLIPVHRFRRKVYPRLVKEDDSISGFVKENHLGLSRLDHVIRILRFYNDNSSEMMLSQR